MSVHTTAAGDHRPRRRLVTVPDARASVPLPRASFYEHLRTGRIPGAVRVGRRVLVDLDVLEAWIDRGGTAGAE